jgi:hypothetical protein
VIAVMLPILAILAVNLLVHEAGHALAAIALRIPWCVTLERLGPGIRVGWDDHPLTRRQVVLTAVGGPLANIALAAVAYLLGQPFAVLVSVEFAVGNLVLPHSDGSRIFRPGRAIARAAVAAMAGQESR